MTKTIKKSFIGILTLALIALLALTLCSCGKKKSSSSSSSTTNTNFSADNFKETDRVEIEVANYGKIVVGLDANSAPITVANFKKLVGEGFYNGLTFHRIMDGFMMQGGDPKGDGTGDSTPTIKGEFSANGVNNYLAHTRGAISMARKGNDNNSGSCQFFIVHKTSSNNSKSLDGQYACFGYVQSGMEVVDKIIADAHPTDNNGTIPAAQQPKITSIKLL